MGKVVDFFKQYWRTIFGATIVLVVLLGVLGYSLGTTPNGYSRNEVELLKESSSLAAIRENPINAPLKLPLLLVQSISNPSRELVRSVTVVYGVLTVIAFFTLARLWYAPRIAILGSLLLLTSSWFLHISRLIQPMILFTFFTTALLLIGYLAWMKPGSKTRLAILFMVGILGLYVSGFIWILLACLVFTLIKYKAELKNRISKNTLLVGGGLTLVALIPLVIAFTANWSLALNWLGLPDQILLLEWLKRLLVVPVFLIAQGPFEPEYNLGRLPLLDIFTTIIVLLGAYAYYFQRTLLRTRLLLIIASISTLLVILNNPSYLSYLLPITMLVAVAGMALLLQQWFTVFPRNPLIRILGVTMVVIVVLTAGLYHTRRYFVAWDGNPNTRNTFIYSLKQ